jgi:hypothetical protein
MKRIIVQEGQSLFDISAQVYGSGEGVLYLLEDNQLTFDSRLSSGDELLVRDETLNGVALVIRKNNIIVNNTSFLDIEITEEITIVILKVSPEKSGGDGYVMIDVEGGSIPYRFQWTNDQGEIVSTSQDLIAIPAGTYNLTVTDEQGRIRTLQGISVPLEDNNTYLTDSDGKIITDSDGNKLTT